MNLSTIELLLSPLPEVIAVFAVALIGIVLAVRHYRGQPTTSRLVIIGLLAMFVGVAGPVVVHVYSFQTFSKWQDASVHALHVGELNALFRCVRLVGLILLTWAAFVPRRSSAQPA
jgi:hypothetical protein